MPVQHTTAEIQNEYNEKASRISDPSLSLLVYLVHSTGQTAVSVKEPEESLLPQLSTRCTWSLVIVMESQLVHHRAFLQHAPAIVTSAPPPSEGLGPRLGCLESPSEENRLGTEEITQELKVLLLL